MEAIKPKKYDSRVLHESLKTRIRQGNLSLIFTLRLFLFPLAVLLPVTAWSQIANSVFEKNRLQYKQLEWNFLPGERFDIYFTEGGEHLAKYAMQEVPVQLEEAQVLFDYRTVNKFRILIYNSYAEFEQTNLFPRWEDDNIGGYIDMEVLKGVVYFTGNHEEFRIQLKAVVARMVLNDWLYGGSIQDILQNSTLINLPDWYVNGLVQFAAEGWPVQKDVQLKEGILSGRFKDFNRLRPHEQDLVGQSLWNYLAQQYGLQQVAGILYYMRTNKNMEAGFVFEIGKRLESLYNEWYLHNQWQYRKYPEIEMPRETALPQRFNKLNVEAVRAHPTEEVVAFTVNHHGALEVWLMDFRMRHFERIFKSGFRIKSSYEPAVLPAMDWNPDGSRLSITYLEKGKPALVNYDFTQKKLQKDKEALTGLDQVLSVCYLPAGDQLMMSAISQGQSDLFIYDMAFRELTRITNDIYDDLQPAVNSDGRVLFLSNRKEEQSAEGEDSLQFTALNIFELLVNDEEPEIHRVAFHGPQDVQQLRWISDSTVAYITSESGIRNRNIAILPSFGSTADTAAIIRQTNYSSNIKNHDVDESNQVFYDLWRNDAGYYISSSQVPEFPLQTTIRRKLTPLASEPVSPEQFMPEKTVLDSGIIDSSAIDTPAAASDVYFQTRFLWTEQQWKEYMRQRAENPRQETPPVPMGTTDYSLTFSPLYLLLQVNNSVFYNRYITFLGRRDFLYDRPWDMLMEFALTDVPGNHRIAGGVRIAADFNELDYFMDYAYLKGRLDKTLSFLRKTEKLATQELATKETLQELRLTLDYPLNRIMNLQAAPFFRLDRTIPRTTGPASAEAPIVSRAFAGTRFQFAYNNAYPRALNLYEGIRFRAWTDIFQGLNADNGILAVPGFEVRTYFTLPASISWASRLTMETSLGRQRVAFYLGGIDNWLYPSFNRDIGTDEDEEYLFKVLAPTLRGFEQNIRNGSSYGVLNTELRFPVFKMLNAKPIRSEFTENFQVVLFGDAGTAWSGDEILRGSYLVPLPSLDLPPLYATVDAIRQPIVQGVGFGFRSILLGYFVKADLAWGIEDGLFQERILYISLGLDF
ncbi:MAG: hypothetical protein WD077_12900 [Bacteroidia bacterium]